MSLSTTSFRSKRNQLLLVITVIFTGFYSFSQVENLSHQSQIIEAIGQDKFDLYSNTNPSYLKFLDTRCSKGYLIMDMPEEKTVGMTKVNLVSYNYWNTIESEGKIDVEAAVGDMSASDFVLNSQTESFNFLNFQFQFHANELTYYVLGNTGKVLMILPVEQINKLMNANQQ